MRGDGADESKKGTNSQLKMLGGKKNEIGVVNRWSVWSAE